MLKKIMSFLFFMFVMILVIGVTLQYYITIGFKPEDMKCFNGKLGQLISKDNNAYVRVKGLTCEYDDGMLIIEEKK